MTFAGWVGAVLAACLPMAGCSIYKDGPLGEKQGDGMLGGGAAGTPETDVDAAVSTGDARDDGGPSVGTVEPQSCSGGDCWWSGDDTDGCHSARAPIDGRPPEFESEGDVGDIYLGWSQIRIGALRADGSADPDAWQDFGLDLDGLCTNADGCPSAELQVACMSPPPPVPFDGRLCRDNTFGRLQPLISQGPQIGRAFGIDERQFNCELWRGGYTLIVRLRGYNGRSDDAHVRVDFYQSDGLETPRSWGCPLDDFADTYPRWRASESWHVDESTLSGPVDSSGALPDSITADPDAYVREGYLVVRPPDGAVLRLIGDAMPYRGFAFRPLGGFWTGRIVRQSDGTWAVQDGLSAGRIRADDLIQSFRETGLCEGSVDQDGEPLGPFYEGVVEYVHDNVDLLADGRVDPSAACDSVSFGIAFEAHQLTPGGAGAVEPLIECCPPGVSADQCRASCGDGMVTGDELCDGAIADGAPGACPTSCPPLDACTPTELRGSACDARCEPRPIRDPIEGDGCCPQGENQTNDDDCDPMCGNGVVERGETCDPVSSCATSCTSSDACLLAVPSGSLEQCNARCDLQQVTACGDGDGCCPDGCSQANDDDCSASCGDSVVDGAAGETCEAGTATPCPSSCDDGLACTNDLRTGSAQNCNVRCTHTAVTQPDNGDGCCPQGANANNDDDCQPVCGNGVVEGNERCDGNCPTSCDDGEVCTSDALVGTACGRRCRFTTITDPANGDGCCPPGANATNDDSCEPQCGNGVVETGEGCDDANTVAGDGCAGCQIETDEQMCLGILGLNDACTVCTCRDCTDVMVPCYGSPDATKNALCKAVIDCGQEHDCHDDGCYCGTAGSLACLYGGANGPCRAEVEAAAESTSPATIDSRKNNTNFALGRANAVADCAEARCRTECGL